MILNKSKAIKELQVRAERHRKTINQLIFIQNALLKYLNLDVCGKSDGDGDYVTVIIPIKKPKVKSK